MPKAAAPQSRPERAKLSPKEALKRLRDFAKRKNQFVAAVRTAAQLSERPIR